MNDFTFTVIDPDQISWDDRIYGGWFGTRIQRDAKEVLARSAQRYIAALEG